MSELYIQQDNLPDQYAVDVRRLGMPIAQPEQTQPTSVAVASECIAASVVHPTSRPANHSAMVTATNTQSGDLPAIVESHDLEIAKFLSGDDSKHLANLAANLIKLQSHIDRCDNRYAFCEDVKLRAELRAERKELHAEYRETVRQIHFGASGLSRWQCLFHISLSFLV